MGFEMPCIKSPRIGLFRPFDVAQMDRRMETSGETTRSYHLTRPKSSAFRRRCCATTSEACRNCKRSLTARHRASIMVRWNMQSVYVSMHFPCVHVMLFFVSHATISRLHTGLGTHEKTGVCHVAMCVQNTKTSADTLKIGQRYGIVYDVR